MTVTASATIRNEAGIHCRPSTHILKAVADCPCALRIVHPEGAESDLSSMLSLMMMGLTCGTKVTVDATGTDEEVWCPKLVELLEFEYDFPNAGEGG